MNEIKLAGEELLDALERGDVRVAEPGPDGAWIVHAWVKEQILAIFRASSPATILWPSVRRRELIDKFVAHTPASFIDKGALEPRVFEVADRVRIVPGGSSVRRGAFLDHGVIVMPPSYVNVGAFVDVDTMIDSHVLVGSCAQIGARVHLSAGAQIGGVLEPANARPVIIEDDVFVGGNTGVYEGVLVRSGAVLAAGTILASGTRVFDVVHQRELRGTRENPLEIPANAVVVPGTRPIERDGVADAWAGLHKLQVACALIVKYRDEKTDRATALEDALR